MSIHEKIGIIICDRYHSCAGGKCFRALESREGAFERYARKDIELVGYTTCGGCTGGNIEYAPAEMKSNGATIIHLATGLVVGYPPCPRLFDFVKFIPEKYNMKVVIGTHPIPEKYYTTHMNLGTWNSLKWQEAIKEVLPGVKIRKSYDQQTHLVLVFLLEFIIYL